MEESLPAHPAGSDQGHQLSLRNPDASPGFQASGSRCLVLALVSALTTRIVCDRPFTGLFPSLHFDLGSNGGSRPWKGSFRSLNHRLLTCNTGIKIPLSLGYSENQRGQAAYLCHRRPGTGVMRPPGQVPTSPLYFQSITCCQLTQRSFGASF